MVFLYLCSLFGFGMIFSILAGFIVETFFYGDFSEISLNCMEYWIILCVIVIFGGLVKYLFF